MFVAIGRMSAPSDPGTPRTQSTAASKVIALASARFSPPTRGARAASLSLVPPQSGQVFSSRNLATRFSPFSSLALASAFSTVYTALKYVKSSSAKSSPFFGLYRMCFLTAGPLKTMSRSLGVRSLNGTSVRTPIAPATCFIRSHINEPHGSTAPSSMLFDSSGTSAARFTLRTMPVPAQSGHAPAELKAKDSAPGA